MKIKTLTGISISGLMFLGLILFGATTITAAPGDLDPTFGNGGRVTTTFNFAGATDLAVQADGKIVAVGSDQSFNTAQIVLARYQTDGSLDSSFGNGGKVSTSVLQFNYAYAMAIQADGKIVVAGYAGVYGPIRDFAVVRYEANGSLDTSFDGDGKVIIDMGDDNLAYDLVIQPDGKIVVGGASGTSQSARDYAFAVARLNSDGSLDGSFDGDGRVITSGFLSDFGATAVALQPDGKIIAAGQSGSGNSANFALVRYNADGSLDASFDGDGKVITAVSNGYDRALDVAVQPDGKIVAVGDSNSSSNIVVAQYRPDGSLDASFDGDGIAVTTIGFSNFAWSVAIQSNDKIVVAGGIDGYFAIVRYNPTGSLDTSFGGDGIVTTEFNNMGNPFAYGAVIGLAIQPDGQIVAAGGWGVDGEFAVFAVARYIGDATSPNPIDDPRLFVRQHYLDFLNRDPDAGGLAYWTDQITQCGSDPVCAHNRRIDVSAAFFHSLEFQQTGSFVYGLYKGALGRQPNYAEFTADHNRVIGGGNLEAEKAALANDFVQRPEFVQHYPGSITNTQFVNTLFDAAGLFPFTAERQAEIDAMNNQGRTRAQVLRNVIDIQAFRDREFNPSFVLMQYFGYMRRDIDPGGYAFWLNVLNGTGNHRGMVCAFITSSEYQLRFGAVTRGNADCS